MLLNNDYSVYSLQRRTCVTACLPCDLASRKRTKSSHDFIVVITDNLNFLLKVFSSQRDPLTVDVSLSEVQRCMRSPMLTRTVSAMGVAGTNSPSRVRS